jgi:hypothetical protein
MKRQPPANIWVQATLDYACCEFLSGPARLTQPVRQQLGEHESKFDYGRRSCGGVLGGGRGQIDGGRGSLAFGDQVVQPVSNVLVPEQAGGAPARLDQRADETAR